uniref:Uncharacterized protein n=1 Tax=Poecilia mexicana TaxID=48701 RepID=A0A3B3XP66_9TELE
SESEYTLVSFMYKLFQEQQFWINQLQACARRHSDSSAKVETTLCTPHSTSQSYLLDAGWFKLWASVH